MSQDFSALYAKIGRPSIAPEKLLWAMLVQPSTASALSASLWSGWVTIGCSGCFVDDPTFDHSIQEPRPAARGEIATKSLAAVFARPRVKRLLSSDPFSVEGTLIEAWTSMKSFRPKDASAPPIVGPAAKRTRTSEATSAPTRRRPPPTTPRPVCIARR